jgi:hypothetical protein
MLVKQKGERLEIPREEKFVAPKTSECARLRLSEVVCEANY